MSEVGIKHDTGKDRWDLLPMQPIRDLVKVLTMGASKYGDWNWQSVEDSKERYYSALMRHIYAYSTGEQTDPESGLSHLAHVICNAVFLYELKRMGKEHG